MLTGVCAGIAEYLDVDVTVLRLVWTLVVVFTGFVPDEDLPAIYSLAHQFILPSFYEGFGIPALEAMSFSCPVISSFSSSLPEIAGNAALYFDPNNHYDLVEKINKIKSLIRSVRKGNEG